MRMGEIWRLDTTLAAAERETWGTVRANGFTSVASGLWAKFKVESMRNRLDKGGGEIWPIWWNQSKWRAKKSMQS